MHIHYVERHDSALPGVPPGFYVIINDTRAGGPFDTMEEAESSVGLGVRSDQDDGDLQRNGRFLAT
jgi:hypothetical protein